MAGEERASVRPRRGQRAGVRSQSHTRRGVSRVTELREGHHRGGETELLGRNAKLGERVVDKVRERKLESELI